MRLFLFFLLCLFPKNYFAQKSDFKHINFSKADNIAKSYKSKDLQNLNKITFALTQNLDTDVEKFRAIYIWVTSNIENDYNLYLKNDRKRKRYKKDSIKQKKWNSKFQKTLFKKLRKKKKTICTGYAYLLKEMSAIVGIKSILVNGSGRTSTTGIEDLNYANHTWNLVLLHKKWYLCDATWAAGIPHPEKGFFQFNYSDAYFLATPSLFFFNHFPINSNHTLLGKNSKSFEEFIKMPILYRGAHEILSAHEYPKKMHHKIKIDSIFTFQYLVKKDIVPENIKFIRSKGTTEKTIVPEVLLKNKLLTLHHKFEEKGFFDIHLYIENMLISTYTFEVFE